MWNFFLELHQLAKHWASTGFWVKSIVLNLSRKACAHKLYVTSKSFKFGKFSKKFGSISFKLFEPNQRLLKFGKTPKEFEFNLRMEFWSKIILSSWFKLAKVEGFSWVRRFRLRKILWIWFKPSKAPGWMLLMRLSFKTSSIKFPQFEKTPAGTSSIKFSLKSKSTNLKLFWQFLNEFWPNLRILTKCNSILSTLGKFSRIAGWKTSIKLFGPAEESKKLKKLKFQIFLPGAKTFLIQVTSFKLIVPFFIISKGKSSLEIWAEFIWTQPKPAGTISMNWLVCRHEATARSDKSRKILQRKIFWSRWNRN